MIDIKIVQDKYASMADAQLIHFARNDSHDLTSEALDLLKQELAKRNLDIDNILIKQEPAQTPHENEEPDTSYVSLHGFSNGLPYEQMIPAPPELNETEKIYSLTKEEDLLQLIKKCDRAMVINGVIFTIGSAVTLLTFMEAQDKGGSVIIAWGAIVFGGVAAFRAFLEKKQLQSVLKEILANQGKKLTTENE
jgi:hypothetical protein